MIDSSMRNGLQIKKCLNGNSIKSFQKYFMDSHRTSLVHFSTARYWRIHSLSDNYQLSLSLNTDLAESKWIRLWNYFMNQTLWIIMGLKSFDGKYTFVAVAIDWHHAKQHKNCKHANALVGTISVICFSNEILHCQNSTAKINMVLKISIRNFYVN